MHARAYDLLLGRFTFLASMMVVAFSLLGGVAIIAILVADEVDDWWLDLGICGPLVAGLVSAWIGWREMRAPKV